MTLAVVACSQPSSRSLPPSNPSPPARFQVARPDPVMTDRRLPRTFTPLAYRARLALHEREAAGTIEIDARLDEPTDTIWLDADGIIVERARARWDRWDEPWSESLEARTITHPIFGDRKLALLAAQPMKAGRVTIEIAYRTPIDDLGVVDRERQASWWRGPEVRGLFRQSYEGKRYLFTMFEPFAARRVFPCVDEPDRRASWTLTLDVPVGDLAASNTPIAREHPIDASTKRVEFAPTMRIPSYLVAFAVGPFDVVEGARSTGGTPIRLLAQHGHGANAKHAADSIAPIVDALDAWTGRRYPFGKLDIVSVPLTGRGWFAMENPGLITVGELGVEAALPNADLDWITTMTHEVAHQWFGNLVTMAWWNDIWLNESLTRWLTDKVVLQLRPMVVGDTLRSVRESVETMESTTSSSVDRAIRAPHLSSFSANDLAPYFGGHRGAAFLDGLEGFLGATTFQETIQTYLAVNALRSMTTERFALHFLRHDGLDAAIRHSVDAVGAPRLWLEVACDKQSNVAHLSTTMGWTVPVCIAFEDGGARAERCILVNDRTDVTLGKACPRWITPNASGAGFYFSSWKPAMVHAVTRHGWAQLTTRERARILVEIERSDVETMVTSVIGLVDTNASDPIARTWIATMLAAQWPKVPDDLRSTLLRKIEPILSRVRAYDLSEVAPTSDEQSARTAEMELAATVGDPAMIQRGPALHGDLSKLAPPYHPWVRLLAARASSALIPELLASSIYDNATVLARVPGIARLLPMGDHSPRLFQFGCSVTERDDAIAAARLSRADDIARPIDACIADRKRLEPKFRSWLAPPTIRGR